MTLYGISSCDTVKKMSNWMHTNDIEFTFHNYRTEGITKEILKEWLKQVPLDKIFNKASTTWRELSAAQQEKAVKSKSEAIKIMIKYPTIIKRPIVIDHNGRIVAVGFNKIAPLSLK